MGVINATKRTTPHMGDWSTNPDRACAGVETDLFFLDAGGSPRHARALCGGCPVQVPCLEYAVALPSLEGIWGGTTADERREIRQRGRGTT